MPLLGPSLVLALLVGAFWTAFAVLVTGVAGARLPFVLVLAVLGAWAGDALGGRLGIDLLRIGEFRLLAASLERGRDRARRLGLGARAITYGWPGGSSGSGR